MFTFEKAKFAGEAGFDNAKFTGYTGFNDVQFTGEGRFDNAQFAGEARFDNAHFTGEARFGNAQFAGDTIFGDANFTGLATFDNAQFTGEARFGNAQFAGYTRFNNAQFAGYTIFGDANFTGLATFDNAQFTGEARFEKAKFAGGASFDNAQFNRDALFYDAQCNVYAGFNDARFAGEANFQRAKFTGEARFDFAQFDKGALFDNAKFEKATALGPLVADRLDLNGAVFSRGIDIRVAAVTISCADAIWEAAGTLRLRYATVILERTTFTEPSFITGFDRPFRVMRHEVDQATGEARWVQKELDDQHISERVSTGNVKFLDAWMPILSSLRGVDAAKLSVTDVNLSRCLFAGAGLLDQLRLEGRCIFDHPPRGMQPGWAWPPVWRWSGRQSLIEERIWRATTPKFRGWAKIRSREPQNSGSRSALFV